MYAVIETGGKQYRVELGTELAVERLEGVPGTTIDFDRVLLVADGDARQIGTPTVADALVTASVVRQDRGEKLIVFKYRPKARHRAKQGHRQEQTVIRVADIRFNGRSAADEAGTQRADEQGARDKAQAEAERKATADQALAAKLATEAEERTTATAESKPAAKTTTSKKTTAKAAAPAESAPAKPGAKKTTAKAAPAEKPAADAPAPKTTRPRSTRSSTKKDE